MEQTHHSPLSLSEKLKLLPESPGVYLMKNEKGEVLYVGKSVSLKDRVRSYFQKTRPTSPRIRKMTELVEDIETVVTRSELDALILENTLIKRYRPKFNVLFRDDKTYPYLRFSWSEEFPRLTVTRRVRTGNDLYYGPFANPGALRETLRSISRLFPLATCSLDLSKKIDRPCIEYQIHRCLGPCANLVSPEDYRKMAQGVRLFLEGKSKDLELHLHSEMERHAKALEFEKAAMVRQRIESVRTILERQQVEFSFRHPVDVIALVIEEASVQIQLLSIRNGRVSGRRTTHIKNPEDDPPEELIVAFIEQHYSQDNIVLPDEILLSHPLLPDSLMSMGWITEKKGGRVLLHHPKRGERKAVLDLALNNAREALRERVKSHGDRLDTLEEVRTLLNLPSVPHAIGCVDISNMGDAYPVASLVVFLDGMPDKSRYRRFRIHYKKGQDDFKMLAEVMRRQFDDQSLPDLLLIDGGRPQIRAVLQSLRDIGQNPHPSQVMGLAKERTRTGHMERIVAEDRPDPLILPPHRPATHLLMRIRDEAHRFANTYHRKLREEALIRSRLLEIPGIGPSREKQLIEAFGSIDSLKASTPEEISSRCSLSKTLADKILASLHEHSPDEPEIRP